jgi:aspartyl protease
MSSTPIAKLTFDLVHNRIYLPVEVNGHQGFSMIVDTGAAMSGLSELTAQALKLQHKGHAQLAGNGSATLSIFFAKDVSFQMGEATLTERMAAIVPYHDFEASEGRPVAGILGVDLFRRYVVVVDYGARTLLLYEPRNFAYQGHGEVVPPEIGKGAIFHARLYVDGRDPIIANLSVDSGTYSGLLLYSPLYRNSTCYRLPPRLLIRLALG